MLHGGSHCALTKWVAKVDLCAMADTENLEL